MSNGSPDSVVLMQDVSYHITPEKSFPEEKENADLSTTELLDSSLYDTTPENSEKTESLKTPKTSRRGRLSAEEKLLRTQEKEARKAERERLRLEKEEKRKLENEEKERKRLEREEQKQKKEAELQEQKERKLREKQEKEEKKRQEMEEKQREIDRKQEEKRKKEEEAKRKEEEKIRQKKEEEERKQRTAERFKSFFKIEEPKAKKARRESEPEIEFELKSGMSLAPLHRRSELSGSSAAQFRQSLKQELDQRMKATDENSGNLYLGCLKKPEYSARKWRAPSACDDEISCLDDYSSSSSCLPKLKTKLLLFHANHRPPYWGTWRKKSAKIRGRRPLAMDEVLLDYEVDSDDEWEEEPEGDDCRSDDEEEDEEKAVDSDSEDGWLVDHGYLSEGEGISDQEESEDPEVRRKQLAAQAASFKATLSKKIVKQTVLLIGPYYTHDPNCNIEPALRKKLKSFATRPICKHLVSGQLGTIRVNMKSSENSGGSSSAVRADGSDLFHLAPIPTSFSSTPISA